MMVTFLNTQAGPTKDLRVRQALHHLWNQEAFNAITGNAANAGPLYTPLLGRDWKMENPYPYDPARAKQLLAEAGFPTGASSSATSRRRATSTSARSSRSSRPS